MQLMAMLKAVLCIIIGLTLLIWAHPIADELKGRRSARLRNLEEGEPEVFFEERRSLETYAALNWPNLLRILGCGWVIIGVIGVIGG